MGKEIHEKCAVFGVSGIGVEAAKITRTGLYALQHRGQDATGISSVYNKKIYIHKGVGLVDIVYNEKDIDALPGDQAIGHNRYPTRESSTYAHAQPVLKKDAHNYISLGHNGNLPSTRLLEEFLEKHHMHTRGLNDSEMMTEALWYYVTRGAAIE